MCTANTSLTHSWQNIMRRGNKDYFIFLRGTRKIKKLKTIMETLAPHLQI